MREAIRVLEHSGLVAVRRGTGGGTSNAIDVHRQREMRELELRIELVPGETDAALVAERLALDIRAELSLRAAVSTAPVGSLPRFELKARRVQVRD